MEHPEQVVVAETNNERALILELKVAPEDMGKVIGKQGRIAKAIRTVVKPPASMKTKNHRGNRAVSRGKR